jgi:D-lactate dehydrogenase
MHVVAFSAKPYDRAFLSAAAEGGPHTLIFHEARLSPASTALAEGAQAVCAFVNDDLGRETLEALKARGVELLALRSAGFNHVDLEAARRLGLAVARVPGYSPHAVAEHTLALILALNRKIHRAYNRVREGNFELEGLLGFDLRGKTVGIVGTGKIGEAAARALSGFGVELLAHDPRPNPAVEALGGVYVPLDAMLERADVLSLHCPLTPETHHLIDDAAVARLKPGMMLVNTSRGAVLDARAAIGGLKRGVIGGLALDVYEEEADLFFRDLSGGVLQDDVFARLLTFPNVLITGHQAFFTREALTAIAETTIANIDAFARHGAPLHPVSVEKLAD